jgi:hypothetical protein
MCPAHLILLHLIAIIILDEGHKLLSASLRNVVHFAHTSSLLGPNFLLRILFQNILILLSSLEVKDEVSSVIYKDKYIEFSFSYFD